jgi:hypothetical protein
MASNKGQENAQAQEQPKPLIADESTMTIWGDTVGAIMANNRRAFEELQADALASKTKAAELQAAIDAMTSQLNDARQANAMLRFAGTFQRLPNGSISFPVVLDADAAAPLLSQAEGAQEEPATFVPRQVAEALLAYSMS